MTRKDFELIAGVFRTATGRIKAEAAEFPEALPADEAAARIEVLHDTAKLMADALSDTNDRFDRWRFLSECKGE